MANNRIYYPIQQVGIKPDGDTSAFAAGDEIRGVQSVGMTTNFNLSQVYQLGMLPLYENDEDIPEIEVTLQKVLDGNELIYHKATFQAAGGGQTPTLIGRSKVKSIFGMSIFADTSEGAILGGAAPESIVQCSGMYVSSLSYTFPIDGEFTEDVTLVGNDKVWLNTPDYGETLNSNLPTPAFPGQFATTDSPAGPGGVNRRENLLFTVTDYSADVNGQAADKDATILPPEVFGISNSGENVDGGDSYAVQVQNITVSADLGREAINELGRKGPCFRDMTIPVEVTTDIEVISTSGDMVSATEAGIFTTGTACGDYLGNLKDRSIRVATCETTRIYTGAKNKLSSVNYTGGDSGGGNVSVTYTYTTFNDLTVMHEQDPNGSGTAWWTARATYLADV